MRRYVFATDAEGVYCAVRAEFLNIIQVSKFEKFSLPSDYKSGFSRVHLKCKSRAIFCSIWLWILVSHVQKRTQTAGFWKMSWGQCLFVRRIVRSAEGQVWIIKAQKLYRSSGAFQMIQSRTMWWSSHAAQTREKTCWSIHVDGAKYVEYAWRET